MASPHAQNPQKDTDPESWPLIQPPAPYGPAVDEVPPADAVHRPPTKPTS